MCSFDRKHRPIVLLLHLWQDKVQYTILISCTHTFRIDAIHEKFPFKITAAAFAAKITNLRFWGRTFRLNPQAVVFIIGYMDLFFGEARQLGEQFIGGIGINNINAKW